MSINNSSDTRQALKSTDSPTFGGLTLSSQLTVPNGGSGATSHTAYAVLCGGTTSTGAVQSIASVGSSGQLLTSNGAGALPTFQAAPTAGKILQQVRTTSTSTGSSSTAIQLDNTIPQSGEGVELLTLAITPVSASSNLIIDYYSYGANNSQGSITVACFVDSTADAIAAAVAFGIADAGTSDVGGQIHMRFYLSSGSTSSRTYKIRAGSNIATLYYNRAVSGALFSTTSIMVMTVTEVGS